MGENEDRLVQQVKDAVIREINEEKIQNRENILEIILSFIWLFFLGGIVWWIGKKWNLDYDGGIKGVLYGVFCVLCVFLLGLPHQIMFMRRIHRK